MKHLLTVLALSALTLTLTTACGNQTDRGIEVKSIGKSVLNGMKRNKGEASAGPSQAELAESINTAMAATDKPLAIAVVENRNGFAILRQVGSNAGYSTWASADKRTISTKTGMITGTRGLGFDLMSADVSASLAAVSGRKSSTHSRSLHFLNGENQTVTQTFSCTTTVGGSQSIAIGVVNSKVTAVTEACRTDDASYENSYQVSPRGKILQSRQWLGPQVGYVFMQALRQ